MRLLAAALLVSLLAVAAEAGSKSGNCHRPGFGDCPGGLVCATCSYGLCCQRLPVFDALCYRRYTKCTSSLTCLSCSRQGPGASCCRRVTKAECWRKCKRRGRCLQCNTGYCCRRCKYCKG